MYATRTLASALDFMQFLSEHSPFPIMEISTGPEPLFVNRGSLQSKHLFTAEAKHLGIIHSVVLKPDDHPVLRSIADDHYGNTFDSSFHIVTRETALEGLAHFLFFHNNHHPLASLGGVTPLQKLKSFAGYERILRFDPYLSDETHKAVDR